MELNSPSDRFYDYCHYEYVPEGFAGKPSPVNLFLESTSNQVLRNKFEMIVSLIRSRIGKNNTVWGVKRSEGSDILKWELYFYNYNKRDRNVTVTNILDCLYPLIRCDIRMNENLPYFMFSIDIAEDLASPGNIVPVDCVHLYFQGYDREVGQCYNYSAAGICYENNYAFFDARQELSKIALKMKNTPVIDYTAVDPRKILCPEFLDCKTICISNKHSSDCIYFSRINYDMLLVFLERFSYPGYIQKRLREGKDEFGYLLFDIGFDYYMERSDECRISGKDGLKGKERNEGKLKISKSGYYGIF